jgi:hypothetical protein
VYISTAGVSTSRTGCAAGWDDDSAFRSRSIIAFSAFFSSLSSQLAFDPAYR